MRRLVGRRVMFIVLYRETRHVVRGGCLKLYLLLFLIPFGCSRLARDSGGYCTE